LPTEVCDAVHATAGYEASIKNFGRFTSIADDNVFGDAGGASGGG